MSVDITGASSPSNIAKAIRCKNTLECKEAFSSGRDERDPHDGFLV